MRSGDSLRIRGGRFSRAEKRLRRIRSAVPRSDRNQELRIGNWSDVFPPLCLPCRPAIFRMCRHDVLSTLQQHRLDCSAARGSIVTGETPAETHVPLQQVWQRQAGIDLLLSRFFCSLSGGKVPLVWRGNAALTPERARADGFFHVGVSMFGMWPKISQTAATLRVAPS
jgi:hypothetical protein